VTGAIQQSSVLSSLLKTDGSGVLVAATLGTDYSVLPSQSGNTGKFLSTDGSALSWADVVTSNIYTADGTLTGNRTVTMGAFTLTFEKNIIVNQLNIGKGGGNVSSNTSVGYESLIANTTGSQNTSIGRQALYASNGSNNTAIGAYALNANTSGNFNTALGRLTLFLNTTGASNTAIGEGSQRNTTGSNNTSLGASSGQFGANANTTGSNNIFIGYQSVGVSATESNRTWIGNSSTTSTWLGGNLLLGTTTDAGYKLDVNGTARVTTGLTVNNNSTSGFQVTDQYGVSAFKAGFDGSKITIGGTALGGGRFINMVQGGTTGWMFIRSFSDNAETVKIGEFGMSSGKFFIQTSAADIATQNSLIADAYTLYLGYQTYNTLPVSAAFAVQSTTQGFLPPRMTTTQRDAIASPATGLVIYNTTTLAANVYNGTSWGAMGGDNIYTTDGALTGNRTVTYTGFDLTFYTVRPSVGNRYITFHNSGRVTFNGTTENTSYEVNVNGGLLAGAGSMIGGTSGVNFDSGNLRLIFQDWSSVSFVRAGANSVLYSDGTTASLGNGSARLNIVGGNFSTNGGGLGTGGGVYSIGPGTNSITTGAYTVSIGSENLYSITTGSTNIAIGGRWAGSGVSRGNTGNHSSSIFLGVGTGATTNSTTLTNTTIIGHDITTDASNTVILGRSDQNVTIGGVLNAGYKLDVNGTARVTGVVENQNGLAISGNPTFRVSNETFLIQSVFSSQSYIQSYNTSTALYKTLNILGDPIRFGNSNGTVLTVENSGSLNMRTTLSAWSSDFRVIQMQGGASFASFTSQPSAQVYTNLFYNGTNYVRISTGFGTRYSQYLGEHVFENTGSDSAGSTATMTTAMKLTAAGRLLLGTTTESTFLLDVNGTARVSGDATIVGRTIFGANYFASSSSTFGWYSDGNNPLRILSGLTGGFSLLNLSSGGQLSLISGIDGNRVYIARNAEADTTTSYTALFTSQTNGGGRNLSNWSKVITSITTEGGGSVSNAPLITYLSLTKGNVTGYTAYRGVDVQDLDSYFGSTSGSVGIGATYSINASAILQVSSITKGFLPPRMTSTQRTAISSPAVGLIVYQTDSTEGTYEYTSTGWRIINAAGGGSGTVTTVSVASANGFAGTVANATTTPAITISTTVTGLLKGNGTAISAATAGTDYLTPSDVAYSVANVSTTHSETATKGTKIIKADTTGGAFTINLPTAVSNTAIIIIKKVAGSGALTIDGNLTETIDGGTTATINKVYESITLISDNTNWQIV
jgi:hypothetical protein